MTERGFVVWSCARRGSRGPDDTPLSNDAEPNRSSIMTLRFGDLYLYPTLSVTRI